MPVFLCVPSCDNSLAKSIALAQIPNGIILAKLSAQLEYAQSNGDYNNSYMTTPIRRAVALPGLQDIFFVLDDYSSKPFFPKSYCSWEPWTLVGNIFGAFSEMPG